MALKFGLGDTDHLRHVQTCWDIFDGSEDFANEDVLKEQVRIVLEDIAGFERGSHFVLYRTHGIPETGYTAVLKVCEEKGFNMTVMRKNGPGDWDWEPEQISF